MTPQSSDLSEVGCASKNPMGSVSASRGITPWSAVVWEVTVSMTAPGGGCQVEHEPLLHSYCKQSKLQTEIHYEVSRSREATLMLGGCRSGTGYPGRL